MKTSRGGTDPPLLIYFPGGTAQRLPPQQPPSQRQRKEEDPVSGPSPGKQHPQGRRVSWRLPRETANHPPPAAGGTRLRGPTRRSVLFFWTGRGPFSFRQDRKENGGRIASANAAFPAPE